MGIASGSGGITAAAAATAIGTIDSNHAGAREQKPKGEVHNKKRDT